MDTPTPAPSSTPVSGGGAPKRYIRTFASDMETLQKGGVPNLAPLREAPLPPAPPGREPPPTPVILPDRPLPPIPKPLPPLEPPPPPAPLKPSLFAPPPLPPESKPALEPDVPRLPTLDLEPAKPQTNREGVLKTYAGDFAARVKESRASIATIVAAEQDAAAQPAVSAEGGSKKNFALVIAGILLVLAGIIGGAVAYLRYATVTAPAVFFAAAQAPIFVDEREQVSGEGSGLIQAIQKSIAEPLPAGSVRFLYLDNRNSSIFAALHFLAPDILERNIQADGSMVGVINTGSSSSAYIGGSQSPFFILSVTSYSGSFSGMLSWEPLIRHDLGALFPAYETATTTMPIVLAATFKDETVANHDVRVFRDATGESVLLYGYWDQKTLVIARDPAAFAEILRRLAVARMQ